MIGAYVVYGHVHGEDVYSHIYFSTKYAADLYKFYWDDHRGYFDSIHVNKINIHETTCQAELKDILNDEEGLCEK